jgi:hypothetical protein
MSRNIMEPKVYFTANTDYAAWLTAENKLRYRNTTSTEGKTEFAFFDPEGLGPMLQLEYEMSAFPRFMGAFRSLQGILRAHRNGGGAR